MRDDDLVSHVRSRGTRALFVIVAERRRAVAVAVRAAIARKGDHPRAVLFPATCAALRDEPAGAGPTGLCPAYS